MATNAQVCPIVGTTNTILPPTHPEFDTSKPGQVCPVTKATTDHHQQVHKHPDIGSDIPVTESVKDAKSCPALKDQINTEENKALDEGICPVVGPVSMVLPPDHPTLPEDGEAAVTCPRTNATLGHHRDKVITHPSVEGAAEGAVCPVVGRSA